jgi:hypothetical protein
MSCPPPPQLQGTVGTGRQEGRIIQKWKHAREGVALPPWVGGAQASQLQRQLGGGGVAHTRHPPFPTPSPAHAPGTTGAGRTGAATQSYRHPGWTPPACGQSPSPAAPWSPSFPWHSREGKGKVADLELLRCPKVQRFCVTSAMSATDSAGSGGAGAAGAGAPAAAPSASSSVGSSGGGGGSGAAAASSAGFAGRVVPEAFAVRGGDAGRP